jgi:hypothetical protein
MNQHAVRFCARQHEEAAVVCECNRGQRQPGQAIDRRIPRARLQRERFRTQQYLGHTEGRGTIRQRVAQLCSLGRHAVNAREQQQTAEPGVDVAAATGVFRGCHALCQLAAMTLSRAV